LVRKYGPETAYRYPNGTKMMQRVAVWQRKRLFGGEEAFDQAADAEKMGTITDPDTLDLLANGSDEEQRSMASLQTSGINPFWYKYRQR
jgi:hypothetical protein